MKVERAKPLRTSGPMRNRIAFFPEHATRTDPFLALAEDWVDDSGGFPMHPHRGFETVTLVLEGSQAHRDSTGQSGVLEADDVQWMTAGRGVLHSEMPRGGFHGLQLWVNLPAAEKFRPARYQNLAAARIPVVVRDGARVRVIAGEHEGVKGPAETVTPIAVLDTTVEAGGRFERRSGNRAVAYVITGRIAEQTEGSVLYLPAGDHSLVAQEPTRLLWMEGAPIGDPIVAHGPFVMNSPAQIEQALRDLREGHFV